MIVAERELASVHLMPAFASPYTVEGPTPELPALSHLRHTSSYVSIRQASIRQHTSVEGPAPELPALLPQLVYAALRY